ncbi:hypothetical protein [Kitasatospora sp. MMS16-BH015]|uniref:hypothetical protein n=1 Tax=Kitasatospora sp. MMS16-BH015 TaxID=2018025 RepID=UPI00131A49EA|nr:hypothetical protein [Kitasatospora sp. MMS16-BH015]
MALALAVATAVTVTAAGPASALAHPGAHGARPSFSAPAAGGASAPAQRALPSCSIPVIGPLFESSATAFEGVTTPLTTLLDSLARDGILSQQDRGYLPPEVVAFYDGLTAEDKQILQELIGQLPSFQTEEQLLEYLQSRSQRLYDGAVGLRNLLKEKVDRLVPEAKDFVNGAVETIRSLVPKSGECPSVPELVRNLREIVAKYRALSEEARASLQDNFPFIVALIGQIRAILF